jgi:PAS domain S-box-containing protein
MVLGLYINIDFVRKAQNPVIKKQAAIIFVTTMSALFLGTVTDVILTLLKIHIVPNLADTFMLIWASGVVYAIVKYKFLAITPATAADNIISTMYDCLILLDLDGKIITINRAASDMLGYEENEIKEKSVGIFFSQEELIGSFFEIIATEGKLKNREFIFKTRKGKEISMLLSTSILRDESGNAAGFVCVAKDISSRKRISEEIYISKKLESIGIFAGGIAHDFNNLFTIIVGNLALARDELSPHEPSYKLLQKAEQASFKAADLALKFITFSPGKWMKAEKIKLSGIIKNARESDLYKKTVKVIYDINIPQDLMSIRGDRIQIIQVMQNLFLNAEAAIGVLPPSETGKISLQAENTVVEDQIDPSTLLKRGKYVKVFISDNGIGIPPEYKERIFDPYFSTHEKTDRQGLGLGLTLCYSIIKKHGGHIALESEFLKGTTVTLYLPAFIDSLRHS